MGRGGGTSSDPPGSEFYGSGREKEKEGVEVII